MPEASLDSAFLMRISLVSALLPDVIQQIHSFRAKGVMSSHTACALGTRESLCRTSVGSACMVSYYPTV